MEKWEPRKERNSGYISLGKSIKLSTHVTPRRREETIRGDQIEHEGYRYTIGRYFARARLRSISYFSRALATGVTFYSRYLFEHTLPRVPFYHHVLPFAEPGERYASTSKGRTNVRSSKYCDRWKMHEPIVVAIFFYAPAVFLPRESHDPSFPDPFPSASFQTELGRDEFRFLHYKNIRSVF